jgi:hypothetical protein
VVNTSWQIAWRAISFYDIVNRLKEVRISLSSPLSPLGVLKTAKPCWRSNETAGRTLPSEDNIKSDVFRYKVSSAG